MFYIKYRAFKEDNTELLLCADEVQFYLYSLQNNIVDIMI